MTKAGKLFDDGRLAIVQGVGYPNPDQSHFRSMAIWQSARSTNRTRTSSDGSDGPWTRAPQKPADRKPFLPPPARCPLSVRCTGGHDELAQRSRTRRPQRAAPCG